MEPQMDMQQLFAAAQQMQEQLMNAQQALADSEVTGTAGGGLVKATVNGQGELLDPPDRPQGHPAHVFHSPEPEHRRTGCEGRVGRGAAIRG